MTPNHYPHQNSHSQQILPYGIEHRSQFQTSGFAVQNRQSNTTPSISQNPYLSWNRQDLIEYAHHLEHMIEECAQKNFTVALPWNDNGGVGFAPPPPQGCPAPGVVDPAKTEIHYIQGIFSVAFVNGVYTLSIDTGVRLSSGAGDPRYSLLDALSPEFISTKGEGIKHGAPMANVTLLKSGFSTPLVNQSLHTDYEVIAKESQKRISSRERALVFVFVNEFDCDYKVASKNDPYVIYSPQEILHPRVAHPDLSPFSLYPLYIPKIKASANKQLDDLNNQLKVSVSHEEKEYKKIQDEYQKISLYRTYTDEELNRRSDAAYFKLEGFKAFLKETEVSKKLRGP